MLSVRHNCMTTSPTSVANMPNHAWRRFFLMLGMFFVALVVACELPTPGSWSDVRSQWIPTAVSVAVSIAFIIASAVTYRRRGPLTGIQASLLCLIFGATLIFAATELLSSIAFLREVRSRHSLHYGSPNQPVERMAAGRTVWQFHERSAAAIAHFSRWAHRGA